MSLFEARIEIAASLADQAGDYLAELETEQWSVFEDVTTKRAWLVGIFASAAEARAGAAELGATLRAEWHPRPVELRELPESEWRDSYKAHFHAWQFGPLHWVPVWQKSEFRLPPGHTVLWLDPGMAFGTGNHETTQLCVERLVQHAAEHGTDGRVVDAGCGSGILALSAAKLGFRDVAGFDNDAEAVRVSEENAALNGLAGEVTFSVDDLVSGLQDGGADVLMANILANVLIRFSRELVAAVAPGGALILSGILASECGEVQAAFAREAPGWIQDTRTLGEWSDVLLRRPVQHGRS